MENTRPRLLGNHATRQYRVAGVSMKPTVVLGMAQPYPGYSCEQVRSVASRIPDTIVAFGQTRHTMFASHLRLSSLSVTSYDWQDYGGGVLSYLHTAISSQSQSYLTTDGQSVSLSWCQASVRDPRPIFLSLPCKRSWHLLFSSIVLPLWREGGSVFWPLFGLTVPVPNDG
jgi:hypothetical protein